MTENFRLGDWAHVRVGQRVQVRMGAGWAKGTLLRKHAHACVTDIGAKKTTTTFDPRNIKPA